MRDHLRRPSPYLILAAGLIITFCVIYSTVTPSKKLNLILISIDTLRADRLGAYGYTRETSPNIDALANEGAVFQQALSTSSWTLPSHVTMLSGLYPSTHGVVRSVGQKIGSPIRLLAEVLKDNGYRTFAYTGGSNIGKRFGFDRGFEEYRTDEDKRTRFTKGFRHSLQRSIQRINTLGADEPYFLFLHTYSVHCPYTPPQPYFSMFQSEDAERTNTNRCGDQYHQERPLRPGEVKYISDRYDGAIRWVDSELKILLDFLKKRGDRDNTLLVITSDHGEEFNEHGRIGHQNTLYLESLHIPFIIAGPSVPPRKIDTPVSLVDLYPTVLDLLSLPTEKQSQGLSLTGLMTNPDSSSRIRQFQYSELDRGISLRSRFGKNHHLITEVLSGKRLFFNWRVDPKETTDLTPYLPEKVEHRQQSLQEHISELQPIRTAPREADTHEDLEQLKSLGYL